MSNYEIIKKARAILQERRSKAMADAEAQNEKLRASSPEIADIDEKLSHTGLLVFRTACAGGDITPVKEANRALQERRKQIVLSLGFPADFGEVKYTCPMCKDTGTVDNIKTCICLKELIIKGRIEASAMGRLLDMQSFENFDLERYSYDTAVYDKMKANLLIAKSFVKDFGKRCDNLLLIGGTGTGKTHLSSAIARELIHLGHDVIYDSTQNIISDYEAERFRSGYSQEESKTEKYTTCPLLILDDMGTEFVNQFTLSVMYNLLNTRQNKGLSTIISTNLSPEELARKYEDRIYSRIIGTSKILAFKGKDLRLEL